jgi:ABC-type multidrug transport system fused ATPase/permease subunit
VVKKVFLLPHDTHISTPTGEFPQLLSKVFQLDGIFTHLYNTVFPMLLELAGAFIIFLLMFSGLTNDASFTPACIYIPVALLLILSVFAWLEYKHALTKSNDKKDAMKGMMKEWGNLMAVVQSYEQAHYFGNVEYEVSRARTSFDRIVQDIKKFAKIDWENVGIRVLGAIMTFSLGAGVVLHLAYGSTDLIDRLLEVLALMSYLIFFPMSLIQFGTAVASLRAAASEYEVLNEFLDRPSNTVDLPGAIDLQIQPNAKAPKIEFRNVSFAYPTTATSGLAEDSSCDNLILDDVSFTILPGQTAGFVGASGCGKSTVFKLMMRFYAPQKGTILVNDQDIRSVTGETLRRAFSVVTQNPKLFNSTLRENVDYGKMGSTDEELIWACKKAELNLSQLAEDGDEDEFSKREVVLTIDKQDNASISTADSATQAPLAECTHAATCASVEVRALDRKCGETGGKLSGGQQQRVALARALLKNGSVFLLDEPTAALDNKVSRELMKTMVEIQQHTANPSARKTLLHITHRLEELKQADQIFYFKKGRIMEQGTFAELVEQKGEFAEQVKAKDHA